MNASPWLATNFYRQMVHVFFFFSLTLTGSPLTVTHQSKNNLKGGWEFSFNINVVTLGSLAGPILTITSLTSSGACCTLQASSPSSGMTSAEHSICAYDAAIPSGPPVTQILSPHVILQTHRPYISTLSVMTTQIFGIPTDKPHRQTVWWVREWPYSAHPPLDP